MVGTTAALIAGGIGLAGAIGGGVANSIAAGKAGDATYQAAQDQVQLAQKEIDAQIQQRAQSITQAQDAARISPAEISAINSVLSTRGQALSASMDAIGKMQAQLDAVDPQVKAAGSNLYDLLSGKSAAILAPLQKQLDLQRQNLVSNLAGQMGPGFMTSSAGIEALTKFDTNSSATLANAQLSAVQQATSTYAQVAGLQQQGQNAIASQTGEAFGRALTADADVLQAQQLVQNRYTNATLGAMEANPIDYGAPVRAQGTVVNTAGGQFAGTAAFGQMLSNIGGAGLGTAGNIAGMNAFGSAVAANYGNVSPGAVPGIPNLDPGFGSSLNQTMSVGKVG